VLAIGLPPGEERLVHREEVPARRAVTVPLPDDLDPRLWSALVAGGITELYAHQAAVWERARDGGHVGVVTGTASGKTLAYALPVLQSLLTDRHARAIYLAPTKALAQDQARTIRALGLGRAVRPAMYDGDTDRGARAMARRHANLFLTNPDMLHVGIAPHLDRWGDVLANLTHVVIDEAHVYRGVFGSHVANVIRRLRRQCALVGAEPRFLLASATVANPAEAMAELIGARVDVVLDDAAPRPARTVALWNPTLLDPTTGARASALAEAAALIAELVARDLRVICFARTRRTVEVVQKVARETIGVRAPHLRDAIAPYRAGYTPEQRRELEARLASGDLRAIVSTNALELGIDIGLLDCALSIGFPGTVASLTQQWGRAGRAGAGLALLIASADALDQYFVRHPRKLLDRPVEAAILDHASPEIHRAHLECAAYEAPITEADDAILGAGAYAAALRLVEAGDLKVTPGGIAWGRPEFPAGRVPLRASSNEVIAIVHAETGQLLGTVERGRAYRTVHRGAIYLHLGESYLVESLDLAERVAVVRPSNDDLYTQVQSATNTRIDEELAATETLGVPLRFGRVSVTEQVLAYQRKRLPGHEVIDTVPLDLPTETFATQALWFTVPASLTAACGDLLGTLHAAEHALISVLPLHAMCDRWDIGGLSTNLHEGTGEPTIFLYDGHPGGVGLTRQGYRRFRDLVVDARDVIRDCPCTDGCPSCVQSPKCGNLNEPLDRDGALLLLGRMLGPVLG
jgi:DEAD/DEAH box helicase domain-containing protein